jgi:hypothetical protein
MKLQEPTKSRRKSGMWGTRRSSAGRKSQIGCLVFLAHQAQVGIAAEVGEVGKDLAYLAVREPHPAA